MCVGYCALRDFCGFSLALVVALPSEVFSQPLLSLSWVIPTLCTLAWVALIGCRYVLVEVASTLLVCKMFFHVSCDAFPSCS